MIKKAIILIIDFYSNYLKSFKLRTCRFYPSCAVYAKEAVEKKGVVRGLALGIWRVLRCNPFSRGGYDPVKPEYPKDAS